MRRLVIALPIVDAASSLIILVGEGAAADVFVGRLVGFRRFFRAVGMAHRPSQPKLEEFFSPSFPENRSLS